MLYENFIFNLTLWHKSTKYMRIVTSLYILFHFRHNFSIFSLPLTFLYIIFAVLKNHHMKNLKTESIILAIGLVTAGLLIYFGFIAFGERDRTVEVRGFSEQNVEADQAVWPIQYRAFGNNLETLYAGAEKAKAQVLSFLEKGGIPKEDISMSAPNLTDFDNREYRPDNTPARYLIEFNITITTKKVTEARDLTYRITELQKAGTNINSNNYESRIKYDYTALDKIKPEMIEASTKNAREAGEKFAKDSGSSLGKIKKARQGYFSIEDSNEQTPWIKKVRVVTTVEYYLKN